MDAAYLVAALAPSHALHGEFEELPAETGRKFKCRCGAGLTFSAFAIAQLLVLGGPVAKEARRGA